MLSRTAAVLIMIDFQGNLAQAMHNKESLFANNVRLIQGFKALNLPILVTEQIPSERRHVTSHMTDWRVMTGSG